MTKLLRKSYRRYILQCAPLIRHQQRADMERLDLKEYEWKTVVRQLRPDDFDALVEMQRLCFPGMEVWKREQIEVPDYQMAPQVSNKEAY